MSIVHPDSLQFKEESFISTLKEITSIGKAKKLR